MEEPTISYPFGLPIECYFEIVVRSDAVSQQSMKSLFLTYYPQYRKSYLCHYNAVKYPSLAKSLSRWERLWNVENPEDQVDMVEVWETVRGMKAYKIRQIQGQQSMEWIGAKFFSAVIDQGCNPECLKLCSVMDLPHTYKTYWSECFLQITCGPPSFSLLGIIPDRNSPLSFEDFIYVVSRFIIPRVSKLHRHPEGLLNAVGSRLLSWTVEHALFTFENKDTIREVNRWIYKQVGVVD